VTGSKWQLPTISVFMTTLMLTACGGSGGGGSEEGGEQTNSDRAPEKQLNSVVFNKSSILTGSACPAGGVEIDTGVDVNGNGLLDRVEITDTYTLCHGSSGNNGLVAMINTSPIFAGIECSLGGVSIQSGMDINGNAKLDLTEVSTSSSICNYNNGAVDGFNSLVEIAEEVAGNNCSYGGQKVATGSDTNRNTILDFDEVLVSKYICQGADGVDGTDGATALVNLVSEAVGANCTNGGMRIDAGLDTNSDRVLQESEITSQNYICGGEDGSLAVNSVVDVTSVDAGETCSNGGQKITSGLDVNNNNILDVGEINRTAYVCNGAGDSGVPSNLPRTEYISYATTESLDLVDFPQCTGAYHSTSTRTEFFDVNTGISELPYAVCQSSSCIVRSDNGYMSLSAATGGDGCYGYHYETHRCNADFVFNEEKSACVSILPTTPTEPSCSSDNLNSCDTPQQCESVSGHWWNSSCNVSCPPGERDTSRGCEVPIVENICTDLQIVQDNQCADVSFTEVNSDICGVYRTPSLIKAGEHFVTCNTTFQDLVVFEAGSTINVDNYWSINAKQVFVNGSAASPVVIQPSLNNTYDKWTDLNINGGSTLFDLERGYLSGSHIQHLQVTGANIVNLNDVSIEYSNITSFNIKVEDSYVSLTSIENEGYPNFKNSIILDSTLTTEGYIGFDYSILLNSTIVASSSSSTDLDGGLYALSRLPYVGISNVWFSPYRHDQNSALSTVVLFNTLPKSTCRDTSFPYYEKNYFSGNKYTGILPTATESCVGESNSTSSISTQHGAYILGERVFTLSVRQSISPKLIVLDSTGLITDAVVVWKVRYDKDGETFMLPESWEGYNPTVTFNAKESYELYIHSINGATDILGHKALRVHVQ
jgi:hypothetical protein